MVLEVLARGVVALWNFIAEDLPDGVSLVLARGARALLVELPVSDLFWNFILDALPDGIYPFL